MEGWIMPTVDIIATADSYIDRDWNINYGTSKELQIDYYPWSPLRQATPFLYFPMTSIPLGVNIESATLHVYVATAEASANLNKPYTLKTGWDENTITGNNRPYPKNSLGNYISAASTGWKTVDIKTFVEWWYQGSQANYGIQIEPEYYNWSNYAAFYSREKTSFEPYIRVTYSDLQRPLWIGPHNNLQII